MRYKIVATKKYRKQFNRFPYNVQIKIRSKIDLLSESPEILKNNIKRLTGTGNYRLRVGDYRVIFSIEEDVITINLIEVTTRGSAYKH